MSDIDRPGRSLPLTAYVWAALLILSFAWKSGRAPSAGSMAPAMTGTRFEDIQQGESQIRTGLGMEALFHSSPKRSLENARTSFRRLARDGQSPGSSRKALVLAAMLDRPLEPPLLDNLEAGMRFARYSASEIKGERKLWASLYGKKDASLPPPDAEKQVRAMRLGLLENQALADLFQRQNRKPEAEAALTRLHQAAKKSAQTLLLLGGAMGLAGLFGVVLLIFFIVAMAQGRREWVGGIAPRPVRLPPGELLDGFLFYLALYMGGGAALSPMVGGLPAGLRLPMVVALQLATGLAGVAYLAVKAKKRDVSLEDIGLSGKNLAANVGFGFLGWCAVLPIIYIAGLASQQLFHGSSATPNPILPLLASDRGAFDRALIFLLAGIGAPLFEEFFFRGALFSSFRVHLRWGAAAALSALVFAMVHPMQDWLPIFALGMAFGTLRELRQSLVPGIVAHCLQNSLAFLMLTSVFG